LKDFIDGDSIDDEEVQKMINEAGLASNVDQRCVYLTLLALYILKEVFDE